MNRFGLIKIFFIIISSSSVLCSCDYEAYRFEKFSRESLANSVWSAGESNCDCTIDGESVKHARFEVLQGNDGDHVRLSLSILDTDKPFCFPAAGEWVLSARDIALSGAIYDVSFEQSTSLNFADRSGSAESYSENAKVSGNLKNLTFTKFSPSPIIVGNISYEWTKDNKAHKILVSLKDPR